MAVDDLNALCAKDVSEQRQRAHNGGQYALVVERHDGKVVDFEAVGHVPDPGSIPVGMGDNDDLVQQAYLLPTWRKNSGPKITRGFPKKKNSDFRD